MSYSVRKTTAIRNELTIQKTEVPPFNTILTHYKQFRLASPDKHTEVFETPGCVLFSNEIAGDFYF